jgi:xanthine dehydrogenase accessory factor
MSDPREEIVETMARLIRVEEPFALATVVRTVAASAAKPGAKALIRSDGSMIGWVGGGCTRAAVEQAARRTLADGKARLIRVRPQADADRDRAAEGVEVHASSCPSGGTVDVFVEPMLPAPRLIVMGGSPAGRALSDLARRIGFAVTIAAPAAEQRAFVDVERRIEGFDLGAEPAAATSFVVVATQGRGDRAALSAALLSEARYVACIASRRKTAALKARLIEDGIAPDRVARLRGPAGLDIGAITPEEIALAIIADIVRERRRGTREPLSQTGAKRARGTPKAALADAIDH